MRSTPAPRSSLFFNTIRAVSRSQGFETLDRNSNLLEISQTHFFFRQALALFIEGGVFGMMVLLETAESFVRSPVIQREVASGTIEVPDEFCAEIVRTGSEKLSPRAVWAVDFFEGRDPRRLDVELPQRSKTHSLQF